MRYILAIALLLTMGCAAGESDRTLWKRMLNTGEKERLELLAKFESFVDGKHEDTQAQSRAKIAELIDAKGKYLPTISLSINSAGVIRKRITVHTIIDEQTALYRVDGKDFVWIEKHPTGGYREGCDVKIDVPFLCTTITKAEVRKSIETVFVLVPMVKP